jgi:hypothetical protein
LSLSQVTTPRRSRPSHLWNSTFQFCQVVSTVQAEEDYTYIDQRNRADYEYFSNNGPHSRVRILFCNTVGNYFS